MFVAGARCSLGVGAVVGLVAILRGGLSVGAHVVSELLLHVGREVLRVRARYQVGTRQFVQIEKHLVALAAAHIRTVHREDKYGHTSSTVLVIVFQ